MASAYQVTVLDEIHVRRMIIERRDGSPICCGWDRLQTLKDEYLGEEACAVEVFPPSDELVNEINRRHFFEVDPNMVPSLYRISNPCW